MKKKLLNVLLVAVVISAAACQNKKDHSDSKDVAEQQNELKFDEKKMEKDAQWAVDVAAGGLMEVKISEMAMKKASTRAVNDFAQMMVNDHSKLNEELKGWAANKNVSLPMSISENHQETYNKLSEKSGIEFEKEYMSLMVDKHENAVDKFDKANDNVNDPDLKLWAATTLPKLKNHLQSAKTTHDMIKDKK